MASAAFSLFFPVVKINDKNYGDGGIRLSSPLRASIRLGADKILVIETRVRLKKIDNSIHVFKACSTSIGSIFGNMMNALFLDNLDRDVEMITKINNALTQILPSNQNKSKWRNINVLCIRPSIDIGELASDKIQHLLIFLRYLMGVFGSKAYSGDFLSFLLFESAFSKPIIDLGYHDAFNKKDSILNFFDNSMLS